MTQQNAAKPLEQTGLVQLSGLASDGQTLRALALRSNVVEMIEVAESAALRPDDSGGFSHSLRAAIACRVSRLNGHQELADHFGAGVAAEDVALCDPETPGETEQMRSLLAFADVVTTAPRDVQAEHIETLKKVGVNDADIVRLCELTAFFAFQYRVIAGLKLMEETA